ncbi:MAG: phosphoribosyltransferase family protein [Balneolales bacterium]
MEYRSYKDLSKAIISNIYKIPNDVDLIVGIPRSGLMAGNLIASSLNLPIIDLDTFLSNYKLSREIKGSTSIHYDLPRDAKHVLLVDDSIYAGKSMAHAKALIKKAAIKQTITSCTVYANPDSTHLVDIYFEKLSSPGCQEWNILHRDKLEHFCVDIDGVICIDPTKKEDDDGPAYLEFLKNAKPLMIPSHKVGYLITGRLEKYRKETESWLEEHHIKYHKLYMLDLPNAEIRWKLRASPKFKAKLFKNLTDSPLFIESDPNEARTIARLSGKKVLCFSNQCLHEPQMSTALIELKIKDYYKRVIRKIQSLTENKGPHYAHNNSLISKPHNSEKMEVMDHD